MVKKVLIVDDSSSMRQLLSFALRDAGYWVITAASGKDAIDTLDGSRIELVITGLRTTDAEAVEFIRQVRNKAEYKFTPIVMLTAEHQETRNPKGRCAEVSGWIMKPFTTRHLVEVVKKLSH